MIRTKIYLEIVKQGGNFKPKDLMNTKISFVLNFNDIPFRELSFF